ncbi:DUF4372 domain-containing protein [Sphingobacterium faecium]|uniref:DUF4372 domain-containing protein n=1 Tax=Sphingobacterium faecium TaxID=34087 RepID=UPI0013600FA6|nr:DUF4372 domain-containing protein [Sphingobacterium faecium]
MAIVNLNVFSQILSLIDRELFKDLVGKHKSDKHCSRINIWIHLVSILLWFSTKLFSTFNT